MSRRNCFLDKQGQVFAILFIATSWALATLAQGASPSKKCLDAWNRKTSDYFNRSNVLYYADFDAQEWFNFKDLETSIPTLIHRLGSDREYAFVFADMKGTYFDATNSTLPFESPQKPNSGITSVPELPKNFNSDALQFGTTALTLFQNKISSSTRYDTTRSQVVLDRITLIVSGKDFAERKSYYHYDTSFITILVPLYGSRTLRKVFSIHDRSAPVLIESLGKYRGSVFSGLQREEHEPEALILEHSGTDAGDDRALLVYMFKMTKRLDNRSPSWK